MTLSELELVLHCLRIGSKYESTEAMFSAINYVEREIKLKTIDVRKKDEITRSSGDTNIS